MTPFRSATFRRLWYSSVASSGAQGMERTATAWLTLEVGGGAVAVGLTFAARMLPSLIFGLVAGTIADRIDRSRQLLAVAIAGLLLMAGFGWLSRADDLHVWLVVLFSFVAGCVQVFDTPARQALVLDTVSRDVAARALALIALATRCATAVGALAIGAIIPLIGVASSYFIIGAVFGVSAFLIAILRMPKEQHVVVAHPPFRQALRDASRLLVDFPEVQTLFIAGVAGEIFAFSHGSALPLFAQDVLAAGPEGLGTLNAAAAIGGALAVMVLSVLSVRIRRQPLLGAIFVLFGLSILAFASTRSLLMASTVLVITGFCAGAFDVLQQILLQMAVPDEQRGRAMGVWLLGIGSAPVGHLEMGLLIAALGAPIALSLNGAVTLIAAVIFLVRAPEYRWTAWTRQRLRGE